LEALATLVGWDRSGIGRALGWKVRNAHAAPTVVAVVASRVAAGLSHVAVTIAARRRQPRRQTHRQLTS